MNKLFTIIRRRINYLCPFQRHSLSPNPFNSLAILAFGFLGAANALASQVYLEDADPTQPQFTPPGMPTINHHLWPRVMMAESQTLQGDIEQYSKYQVIATQAGVLKKVGQLQKAYPDIMYFRMFNPAEFAGYNDEDRGEVCPQGNGIPFSRASSSTAGCGVFAGHWLYRAGTTSTGFIGINSTSIPVRDVSRFKVGQFAVIYASPARSFKNAEHVKVIGKTNNTLKVQRAYKSTAKNHASGSIVAAHVTGSSSVNEPRNWVYNLSSVGPRDGANRRLVDYLPQWLAANYKKNWRRESVDIEVSGFLFDSDINFLSKSKSIDANNDLVVDHGLSNTGANWHGQGLDRFYRGMRQRFPKHIIVGGTRDAAGFDALNGVQMEGFPAYDNFKSQNPTYEKLGGLLAKYTFQSRYKKYAPAHSHVIIKTPTKLYPFGTNPPPTSNKPFRFAFGMTLLEDGYFVAQNQSGYSDMWFDEYAVDVTSGSPTYGQAIVSNPFNESRIRAHTGWLGKPLNLRKRVYSDNQYRPGLSLLQSGSFENPSDISRWQGKQIRIATTTAAKHVQDGNSALYLSKHLNYQPLLYEASAKGPVVNLIKNKAYSFVFSAKASTIREISVTVGSQTERFLLGANWRRFVMTFTARKSSASNVRFNVGQENTEVWLDSVNLFEGNANIFRRDFDKGIVIVNATPSAQTIALGDKFTRIKGTQDPVNNGAEVTSVTLPAYDAALLVKRERQPKIDSEAPNITISAPTKTSLKPIKDTRIVVRDNAAIQAGQVVLRSKTTAGVSGFNCSQLSATRVDCTVTINSSGDIRLLAIDAQGNKSYKSLRGYKISADSKRPRVNGAVAGLVPVISLLLF